MRLVVEQHEHLTERFGLMRRLVCAVRVSCKAGNSACPRDAFFQTRLFSSLTMAARNTRSRSRPQCGERSSREAISTSQHKLIFRVASLQGGIASIPIFLSQDTTTLPSDDFDLLHLKQSKLRNPHGQVPAFIRGLNATTCLGDAAAATLVFAQQEAGTAVCISSDGLLLTCAHCVAESQDEFERKEDMWLLFASGCIVRGRSVVWDARRDLALLQIVAAQASSYIDGPQPSFPFASIGESQGGHLLCIGHPGSEDLEASTSGIETNYDVLHVSTGRFRGLATEQDPQDNSEIGALMHDCWTYWGHSGAPLIARRSGKLVGLHSSWDDSTGMRRGVPLVAVKAFLDEHTVVASED